MAWVLFSIITNPSVDAKVVAELEQHGFMATEADPEPRILEYDDIPKLPYLTAVVSETMRFLTVRPILCMRIQLVMPVTAGKVLCSPL
jgi:cytochrome P450